MKKIYFACSIRGGRDDAELYAELVETIKKHSEVLTEIFADGALSLMGSAGTSSEIYEKDITWVREADGIIAEVTNPSLGVGYEIAKAEEWGKPVLALYREQPGRRLSAMIDGSPGVKVQNYSELPQVEAAISDFITGLSYQPNSV